MRVEIGGTFALVAALLIVGPVRADPECAGPDHWAANMTRAYLKNSRLLDNNQVISSQTKSDLIASQRIGGNLYKQVFKATFYLRNRKTMSAIAVSDSSSDECSMSDVTVYPVLAKDSR
jgi:hypothetical protein